MHKSDKRDKDKLFLTSKEKQKIRPPNSRQLKRLGNKQLKKRKKQMTKLQSSRQHKRLRQKQLKMKETCKLF